MSVQAVAPHSVAINAINKISVRSCSALSARGSGNSEKHSANPFISRSLQIRSALQNPLPFIWQLLTESNMRFPCLEGEGRRASRDASRGGVELWDAPRLNRSTPHRDRF